MSPKDDETSLGNILVDLGIINKEQLQIALEKQENSTLEQLLGIVLVHAGFCTQSDVDMAARAQKRLRMCKKSAVARAVTAIDAAIHKRQTNGARSRAMNSAAAFFKKQTGQDYPAVTPELLKSRSGGG